VREEKKMMILRRRRTRKLVDLQDFLQVEWLWSQLLLLHL
jgi:hypothetical protein